MPGKRRRALSPLLCLTAAVGVAHAGYGGYSYDYGVGDDRTSGLKDYEEAYSWYGNQPAGSSPAGAFPNLPYDPLAYYDYDDYEGVKAPGGIKACWTADDGKTVIYNGTFCDLMVSGATALTRFKGTIDGYYRMEGCHNEHPMFKLRAGKEVTDEMEEHLHFVYSSTFHDWGLYDVREKDIDGSTPLVYGGGNSERSPDAVRYDGWKAHFSFTSMPAPSGGGEYITIPELRVSCADAERAFAPEVVRHRSDAEGSAASTSNSTSTSAGQREGQDYDRHHRRLFHFGPTMFHFAFLGGVLAMAVFGALLMFVAYKYMIATGQWPDPRRAQQGVGDYNPVVLEDDQL